MVQQDAHERMHKSGGLHVSRRTVARGMAWSVPVVAVATAAPAWANHSVPIIITPTGVACKHPGEGKNIKSYHFTFCFNNTSAFAAVVSLDGMIVNGVQNPAPLIPTSVSVNAGQNKCIYVDAQGFGDSANGTATLQVSYTINGQFFEDEIVVPFAGDAGLPVCGNPAKAPDEPNDPPPHDPDGPS